MIIMSIEELRIYLQGLLEVLEEWEETEEEDNPVYNNICGRMYILRKVIDLINENYDSL